MDEETLPFSGELIQVRAEERDWEGAIERLLHGFGLSVLVSDVHYGRVADWVNQNHLAGRLVYYRVRKKDGADRATLRRAEILDKVELKADSQFYGWLESQIDSRFPHVCCDTPEQFRREPLALTRTGQIKGSNDRHEKDDRTRIDDRGRYILGWSNNAKIAALEMEAKHLQTRIRFAADRLASLMAEIAKLQTRQESLRKLEVFESFADLDWRPLVVDIDRLERERRDLEAGSDVLRLLQEKLAGSEIALKALDARIDKIGAESARAAQKEEQWKALLEECNVLLAAIPPEKQARYFPLIDEKRVDALAGRAITIESCDARADSGGWRSAFRSDGDQYSEVMPISIPN